MDNLSNEALFIYGIFALGILIELFLVYKNIVASSWQQTRGDLISSDVELEGSGTSFGLVAKVNYEYIANGKEYQSDHIAFATLGSGFALFKNLYFKDNNVRVFFNPANPQQAVILPGIRLFHILDIGFILGLMYYIHTLVDL